MIFVCFSFNLDYLFLWVLFVCFRLLVSGIGPAHMVDCKAASNKICAAVMGDADFQLGKTKVFLKVIKHSIHLIQ